MTRVVTVSNLDLANEQTVTPSTNSVTITWTTTHEATSRVVYDTVSHNPVVGTDANYGYANSTVEDSATTTAHSVTVTGLSAGTTYYFRPVSHGSPETLGTEISVSTSNPSTPASSGGGGSSNGGNSGGGPIAGSSFGNNGFYFNLGGSVLGASTSTVSQGNSGSSEGSSGGSMNVFKFLKNLSKGMMNSDVLELQKRLVTEGLLTIDAPTNYFGNMTFNAVKAYQTKVGLEQVGNVGPKTRAALNGNAGTMMSGSNASLIAMLEAQLKLLMDKIAALTSAASSGASVGASSTSTSTTMTSTSTSMMTGTSTSSTMGTSSTTQMMASSTQGMTSTSSATSTQ
jgi:hypothetical protein